MVPIRIVKLKRTCFNKKFKLTFEHLKKLFIFPRSSFLKIWLFKFGEKNVFEKKTEEGAQRWHLSFNTGDDYYLFIFTYKSKILAPKKISRTFKIQSHFFEILIMNLFIFIFLILFDFLNYNSENIKTLKINLSISLFLSFLLPHNHVI